jgi:hypothetical protein
MDTAPNAAPALDSGLIASLTQLFPTLEKMVKGAQFLLNAPVIRMPYILATSAAPGQTIAAGAVNTPLNPQDFSHSLEWPFQVSRIRFSNDPQHTFRDWRVMLIDQTYNQQWMKNPVVVDDLIDANTGFWDLPFPWIVRPQGGGQQYNIDNLDTVNPITVNIALHGALLIPSGRK